MAAEPMNQIRLQKPIARGEHTIEAVELRKPNGGALRKSRVKLVDLIQMDARALASILPRITKPALSPDEVDELCSEDFGTMGMMVAGFFFPKEAIEAERKAMIAEIEDAETIQD